MEHLFDSLSGEMGDPDWLRIRKMWGRPPAGIPVAIPRPIFGSMAAGLHNPTKNELRRQLALQRLDQLRRPMRQNDGYLIENRPTLRDPFAGSKAAVALPESYDPAIDAPLPSDPYTKGPAYDWAVGDFLRRHGRGHREFQGPTRFASGDATYYDAPWYDDLSYSLGLLANQISGKPLNEAINDSRTMLGMVSGSGTAMSADAARHAYRQGDYLGAALNAGAAALDLLPGVGHLAAGAIGHLAAGVASHLTGGGIGHLAAAGIGPLVKLGDKQLVETSEKELADAWNHPLSNIKLSRRYGEITSTNLPRSPLKDREQFDFNTVDPNSFFVHPPWDRTATGIDVTGVNGMQFETPVELDAGPDLLRGVQQLHDKVISASDPRVLARHVKIIRGLQETGRPVYLTPVTMGHQAGDYAVQTIKTLQQMEKHRPLTEEAKYAIMVAMRLPGHGFPADHTFPGWDKIDDAWIMKAGWRRTKLAKIMDTRFLQNMGAPDVASARMALILPALRNVPTGVAGYNIARVGSSPVALIDNPTYPLATFRGQMRHGVYVGSSPRPIPMHIHSHDWLKGRPEGESLYETLKWYRRELVVQQWTHEQQDRVLRYFESEEGKRLGWAGAIAAGLITIGQARNLFGYDANGKS